MCGKEFNKAFELYDPGKKKVFLICNLIFRKNLENAQKGKKSLKLKVIFKET